MDGGVCIDVGVLERSFCSMFRFAIDCFVYASLFGKLSMLLIGSLDNSHTMREGGQIRQRLRGYKLGMCTAHVFLLPATITHNKYLC